MARFFSFKRKHEPVFFIFTTKKKATLRFNYSEIFFNHSLIQSFHRKIPSLQFPKTRV